MRMRRKKHLDERMDQCSDLLLFVEGENFYIKPEEEKNNLFELEKIFNNNNSVELEIGCGKGQFICEMAKRHSDRNFIAIEKLSNVIVAAAERIKEENIKNVRFLNISAENILHFLPKESIEKIYLNFSCPFPKKTYENRRLTNVKFLNMYKEILKSNGEIQQKTDNLPLFEFSLEEYEKAGFKLRNLTRDLHKSDFKENVVTEYEFKFMKKGLPIFRVEAIKGE